MGKAHQLLAALCSALCFCCSITSAAETGENYRVVGVLDGDTIDAVNVQNKAIRCRLAGIDAPEKNQAYGQVSKRHLSDLIFGKDIRISVDGTDRYSRSICWIWLADGQSANYRQVQAGLAWVYRAYNSDASFIRAEAIAKGQRKGFWAGSLPAIPPWEFRHKH